MATTPANGSGNGQSQNGKAIVKAAVVIAVGVLGTTLAQTQVLGRIPIQNLLKNELHVERATNAAFFFWIGFPWYLKPLFGIFTDAYPLFGSRRKSWMLIGSVFAALAWLGLYFTPHRYSSLLWVCVLIATFMMMTSTVVGAYMVEVAQAVSGSGRLTSVRNFVEQFSFIIMGPTAGYLGSIAFGWTAVSCASVIALVVPATVFFMHEQRIHIDSKHFIANAKTQLVHVGKAHTMWAAAGFMALFYCAPGLSTALFYKQQNDLHMNTKGQGHLVLLSGICGVIAASLYGAFASRRLTLRSLLWICLGLATLANFGYMFYSSVLHAEVIESFNGFCYTLAEVAMMDLAVRSTPAGSEGMGFALMMSVRNFILFGSDWAGSKMLDTYHLHFNTLVVANGATTALTLPLVFLLPAVIVATKDAQRFPSAAEPAPAPRQALQGQEE